ncbi:MAG: Nramp family divalent metal transporter, partial [Saprospiraceae bacterium]|nr:Nramp family divalent metal transporter [Saprospiraceae bacterium]
RLGPGLLFAGAAVGVSHLVLSTKAGANYGFGLIWLVLLANLVKYPFFEYGPRYASSTGESLLAGYNRLGKPILGLFIFMTLGTMFTIQAAVTIVTASLAINLIGSFGAGAGDPIIWSVLILVFCTFLLRVGKYKLLDNLIKGIIIFLSIITLITVIIAWDNPPSFAQNFSFSWAELTFLIMLIGWMPAPLDLSVWHSIWALEKQELLVISQNTVQDEISDTGKKDLKFDRKDALFDFNVGFIGTAFLALFFVALGALVMYGSGKTFSPQGGKFAAQLIELYTDTLGEGVGRVVAIAAFITMFSTTITCLDALPKAMAKAQVYWNKGKETRAGYHEYYLRWFLILLIGAVGLIVVAVLLSSSTLGVLVKVATILSFLTAPFFALANYWLVTNEKYISREAMPPKWMRILGGIGILFLIVVGIGYLVMLIIDLF